MLHINLDLSRADAYDELFPPSLFIEPANQPPDLSSLSEGVPLAAETDEAVNVTDEAFKEVEECSTFVGKTQVNKCLF